MNNALTLLSSIAFGIAVLGVLYAGFRLFRDTPDEDRTYKDKPPSLFRVFWPLVLLLGSSLAWTQSVKAMERTEHLLRRGGQDFSLTPEQFVGGKALCALIGLVFGFVISDFLDRPGLAIPLVLAALAFMYPNLWLKEVTQRRNNQILKALPFFVDLLTLSIEAGLNLSGSLQAAVQRSRPSPLVSEVERVLREIRGGKPRADALRDFSSRLSFAPVSSFVSALIQGERTGSSLGPILRAQSDQRRIERFLRAEKLAMEAPVKMLGPLILCIFPCTFVVLGFPIAMKFLASGL